MKLKTELDPVARVVRLEQRGELDVRARIIEVPFAVWKAITATLLEAEVQAEAAHAQRQQEQRVVTA